MNIKSIIKYLVVMTSVTFANNVIAQEQSAEVPFYWLDKDGNRAPDTPWQKSNGILGVMQVLSIKPEEFLANWDKPTDGFYMDTANKVSRGKPIVSFVLFTGCKPDEKGNCRLGMEYRVLAPSGEMYSSSGGIIEAWVDKPAPKKQQLQLSVNYLGTIIEPKDELGDYTVFCMIYDLNAGTELLTKQIFKAVE